MEDEVLLRCPVTAMALSSGPLCRLLPIVPCKGSTRDPTINAPIDELHQLT